VVDEIKKVYKTKTITTTEYQCSICKRTHILKYLAEDCERHCSIKEMQEMCNHSYAFTLDDNSIYARCNICHFVRDVYLGEDFFSQEELKQFYIKAGGKL